MTTKLFRFITHFIIIMLAYSPTLFSQSFLSQAEFRQTLASYSPSSEDDSLAQPHTIKPKLLPEHMSFLERTLWGENGALRSIGIASPLTAESRKSELGLRRTMLTMHQIGGYVTLALMGTTVYFGQKTLDGRADLRDIHTSFAAATIISYGATAMLSVLSPPPLIRRDENSSTTIHKTLAWIHFAGMILTPILGSMIERHADYEQRARFHQVSAYITTAVFTASMIVMTF